MAISVTTDPIVTAAYVTDATGLDAEDEIDHLINFASAAFLRFTNRARITSGAVTETVNRPPRDVPVIWLKAAPVDTDETFTILSLFEGETNETLSESDYSLTAASGRLYLRNHTSLGGAWGYQLQIDYTGGWTTVPNDVMGGAIELIRVMRQRSVEGQAGVRYSGFGGTNQGLETAMITESVADAWWPYRILP